VNVSTPVAAAETFPVKVEDAVAENDSVPVAAAVKRLVRDGVEVPV